LGEWAAVLGGVAKQRRHSQACALPRAGAGFRGSWSHVKTCGRPRGHFQGISRVFPARGSLGRRLHPVSRENGHHASNRPSNALLRTAPLRCWLQLRRKGETPGHGACANPLGRPADSSSLPVAKQEPGTHALHFPVCDWRSLLQLRACPDAANPTIHHHGCPAARCSSGTSNHAACLGIASAALVLGTEVYPYLAQQTSSWKTTSARPHPWLNPISHTILVACKRQHEFDQ